jgi:hypothetical protein
MSIQRMRTTSLRIEKTKTGTSIANRMKSTSRMMMTIIMLSSTLTAARRTMMKVVEMVVGRTFIKKAQCMVVGSELRLSRRSRYAILPMAFASIAMQTLNTPSILILPFPAPVLPSRQFCFGRSIRDMGIAA